MALPPEARAPKKRRRKPPRPQATSAPAAEAQRQVRTGKIRPRPTPKLPPKRTPVRAPGGDISSSGGDYGRKRAAPEVKRVLRTIERKQAAARARQREVRDIKGASEFKRAEAHKATREYKEALSDAAYAGALVRGLSMSQAARTAGNAPARLAQAGTHGGFAPRFIEGQFQTGRALVEDPLKVGPKTIGQLAKYAVGAPAGLVETALHPRRTLRAAGQDLARRYDVLEQPGGEKRFRERVKREGAAPELLEGVLAVSPSGALAGRGLQSAARSGTLGKRARRVATERPDIRISGGEARPQETHPNFIRNLARARVDRERQRVQRRRAEQEDAPIEVRQAQERGEVTYVSRRRQQREQRKLVAREKGTTLQRFKAQQQRETNAARENIGSLSKEERRGFNFAHQFGATTPQAARALLARRQRDIAATRAQTRTEVSSRRDQVPELKWLQENADKVFTPNLRRVVREEQARERRLSTGDPGVDAVQAQLRRYQPQAVALGIERGSTGPLGPPRDAAPLKKALGRINDEQSGARLTNVKAGPFGDRFVMSADIKIGDKKIGRISRFYDPQTNSLIKELTTIDPEYQRRGIASRLAASEERAFADVGVRKVEVVPSGEAGERLSGRVGGWRSINDMGRLGKDLPEAQALRETDAEFLRRLITTARREGLERPGYIKSEERATGVFAPFAVGGRKATGIPKPYEARLLRRGTESMDPEVHVRGIAQNVKRREQWNLVARNFDRHSIDKIGGRSMRNRGVLELTRDLENAGVDLSTVAFWNPRKFYEASRGRADTEGREFDSDDREGTADIQRAFQQSVATGAQVKGNPRDFKNSGGWSVVPAEVLREIEADTRPSGIAGRAVDISRGKISRVLLANPAWLTFQVASNAFLTGLTGTGPMDAVKAQRWWKNLPDEQKEALAPELGITGWYDEQTRLGSTANNQLVNSYRAFKQTNLYRKLHKGNPLDALFRADQAQNNFFRKAVFYNQAKREAYRRMGDNATRMMRAQQGIQRILKMDPEDRIREAATNPRAFEHHARAVRDFLGDYTSYTAKERRTLGRFVLFYGFLRHSLRLTFYTLPVKHPIMTAIGLELGKMHDDELRRVFGVDVPAWEQANAFVGGRKFDVGRLNPFFNAIQYQGPQSLLMVATPLLGMTVDQVAARNTAFDQPWRVGGSGSYVTRGRDVSAAQRGKIALGDVLNLSPYYRYAAEQGIPGVAEPLRGRQTDESTLLFPDPVQYRTPEPAARNLAKIREQEGETTTERAGRFFFPVAGERSAPVIRTSREYAASQGETVPVPAGGVSDRDRRVLRRAERASRRQGSSAALDRALRRARRANNP